MQVKVKLINKDNWEKVIEVPGYPIKTMNLFGEEKIEHQPPPTIYTPELQKRKRGLSDLGSVIENESIISIAFRSTGEKDSNGLWIFEELS